MGSNSHACASNLLESLDNSEALEENGFSKNQLDNLYWYFSQCEHNEDPVGGIIEMYKSAYSVTKTRLTVIQALLSQGIITHAQYMSLMYMKSMLSSKPYHEGSVVAEAGSEHCDSDGHETDGDPDYHPASSQTSRPKDQVEVLKDLLKKQGKAYLLSWLQQILLDTCHVKLKGGKEIYDVEGGILLEPVPFHFNCKYIFYGKMDTFFCVKRLKSFFLFAPDLNQSIPVVPWNKQQESGLQTETFILLLHKLGFHLAADVGKCFPRIPHFWSADHILQLGQKLAPLKPDEIKFDITALLAAAGKHLERIFFKSPQFQSDLCCYRE